MRLLLVSLGTLRDLYDLLMRNTTGRLKPGPMITSKIRIDEVEEKGFKALVDDKDNHIKILIDIGLGVPQD